MQVNGDWLGVAVLITSFFESIHNMPTFLIQTHSVVLQTTYDYLRMSQSKFDPKQPSLPISYPIDKLEDLESGSYFESFHYPFNKASVPIESGYSAPLPDRRRILVCHDMAGGYLDDKWVQGGTNADAYAIWHWHLIDVFVYFSHNLVTLPPPSWTNAAHRHGVKVVLY